jgi:hypothetical protein
MPEDDTKPVIAAATTLLLSSRLQAENHGGIIIDDTPFQKNHLQASPFTLLWNRPRELLLTIMGVRTGGSE